MNYLTILLLGMLILAGCREARPLTGQATIDIPATEEPAEVAETIPEESAIQDNIPRDRSKTYRFDSGSRPRIRPGRPHEDPMPIVPPTDEPYTSPEWIRERQAIEVNPDLRCTEYYDIYKTYFLDVKDELHDFQERYLRAMRDYYKNQATVTEVSKIEWRMKEKEVVYGKVQDAFRRLNEECNKTYDFATAAEVFIETVEIR